MGSRTRAEATMSGSWLNISTPLCTYIYIYNMYVHTVYTCICKYLIQAFIQEFDLGVEITAKGNYHRVYRGVSPMNVDSLRLLLVAWGRWFGACSFQGCNYSSYSKPQWFNSSFIWLNFGDSRSGKSQPPPCMRSAMYVCNMYDIFSVTTVPEWTFIYTIHVYHMYIIIHVHLDDYSCTCRWLYMYMQMTFMYM